MLTENLIPNSSSNSIKEIEQEIIGEKFEILKEKEILEGNYEGEMSETKDEEKKWKTYNFEDFLYLFLKKKINPFFLLLDH